MRKKSEMSPIILKEIFMVALKLILLIYLREIVQMTLKEVSVVLIDKNMKMKTIAQEKKWNIWMLKTLQRFKEKCRISTLKLKIFLIIQEIL